MDGLVGIIGMTPLGLLLEGLMPVFRSNCQDEGLPREPYSTKKNRLYRHTRTVRARRCGREVGGAATISLSRDLGDMGYWEDE